MRICADCENRIGRRDKYKFDGSTIRHVSCANPELIEHLLPLLPEPEPSPDFTRLNGLLEAATKGDSNGS